MTHRCSWSSSFPLKLSTNICHAFKSLRLSFVKVMRCDGLETDLVNEFCVSCLILIESVWTKGSKWRSGLAGLKRSISRH